MCPLLERENFFGDGDICRLLMTNGWMDARFFRIIHDTLPYFLRGVMNEVDDFDYQCRCNVDGRALGNRTPTGDVHISSSTDIASLRSFCCWSGLAGWPQDDWLWDT